METTAAVIAHYESTYIKALRSLHKAEARLNTKGTRESRAAAQDRKSKATGVMKDTHTILAGLYTVFPMGMSLRFDEPTYWGKVLRQRMADEDAAEHERRGAAARAAADAYAARAE